MEEEGAPSSRRGVLALSAALLAGAAAQQPQLRAWADEAAPDAAPAAQVGPQARAAPHPPTAAAAAAACPPTPPTHIWPLPPTRRRLRRCRP